MANSDKKVTSKDFNEVARNSIWREHCKKESKVSRLNTNFSIPNPLRMTILPDKPNNTVPYTIGTNSNKYLEATRTLETLCNAKDTHKLPNQIHVLPITSNQDYGFQYEPLVKPDPMFAYNHQKCDVTAYAETYCSSMNGQSPFAKPEGAAAAAAVKK